jgi:hypothetical protein
MKKALSALTLSTLLLSQFLLGITPANASGKISISPTAPAVLSGGATLTFTLRLTQPIICAGSPSNCSVVVTLTNPSPSTITLNLTTVEWLRDDWAETREFTAAVIDPLLYTSPSSVRITSITSSESVFYDRFVPSAITLQLAIPASPSEIAQQAKAAAEAAAEAAAIARANEIENYRDILFAKLVRGERPLLADYRNALFNQVSSRTVEAVTDQILQLETAQRSDVARVNSIADGAAFYDAFFNPTFPATVGTYNLYGYLGVTERILAKVNSQVQMLPVIKRADGITIEEIIKIESFLDQISNSETRRFVTADRFVKMGLLSASSIHKASIIKRVKARSESEFDSIEEVKAVIAEGLSEIQTRKDLTATIKARITARKK